MGVSNALSQEERLASSITDSIAPLLIPDIEIQTYRNKELLLIRIPHIAGPYYLKDAGPEKGVGIIFALTLPIELLMLLCLHH